MVKIGGKLAIVYWFETRTCPSPITASEIKEYRNLLLRLTFPLNPPGLPSDWPLAFLFNRFVGLWFFHRHSRCHVLFHFEKRDILILQAIFDQYR